MKQKQQNVYRRWINLVAVLAILLSAFPVGLGVRTAQAISPNVIISQVYGGGGNSGGIYTNDFVELFNRGATTVSLDGWSIQYASATGTGNFGSSTNLITPLSGSLAPGQYLLVQEAAGSNVIAPLPTPDVTDSTPIAMSGTGAKVALVNTTTPLECNGVANTCTPAALATIVDLVGWDGANFYETTGVAGTGPAPATTNSTAILRNASGCVDTDNNAGDFTAGTPMPRNTSSPLNLCGGPPPIPSLTINDVSVIEGNSGTTTFTFIISLTSAAGAGGVTFDIATQDDSATSLDDFISLSLTGQSIPEGQASYPFSVFVNGDIANEIDETFIVNVTNVTNAAVVDAQGVGTIVNDDAPDAAPTVASTFPVNGATNFPVGSNLTVTFSEPVNVSASWFKLECSTSGAVSATFSGGPTTFTLDPGVTLVYGETCTLTVLADQVSDQDGNDPPDNMVINFTAGFTTELDPCLQPFNPIYQIQGNGLATPIPGTVTTQGIVVGDFEGTGVSRGFYIQDLTGDGDSTTSDGIFVYTGSANLVNAGEVVRVTGYARERFNQTTLNGSNSDSSVVPAANIRKCGTGSVSLTDVFMPFADANDPERFEGMLVRFPQSLVIAEYFNYDQFGEIVLALPLDGESRPFTGTALDTPGAPANARTLANSLRRITLDDAQSGSNPSILRHPNGLPFSLSNLFRGGDLVTNTVGVLGYDFSLYRVVPTGPADSTAVNPRPIAPEDVGGTVRVAAMNTLNFFLTPDYPSGNSLDNKCGPLQNVECRGWDSDQPLEFTRQRDKLLVALSGLTGDIIGLNELENTTGVDPLANIVAGLPGYSSIDTGVIGTDAIRVGMIYRPAVVTPVGDFKILTTAMDPRFLDTKNRPTLAQTFEVNATGARFTVAVNHFKSKGSACTDVGDLDLGDGQGNCSGTRTLAAQALVDWLATDPTNSGDPDFIIMGDLNSYAREDPVTAIKAGPDDVAGTSDDFTNLIAAYQGAYAYSYTFDGQAGYLDYALASASLVGQVQGAADWHINSDEPDVVDYDMTFKPPSQEALYEPNGNRSSDHDPVVVGLVPNASPTVDAGGPYSVNEGSSVTLTASGLDPNGDSLTYAWDLDGDNVFETPGQSVTFSAANLDGPSSYTVQVQVSDPGGLTAVDTATVDILNVAPTVNTPSVNPEPSTEGSMVIASAAFSDPGLFDAPYTCTVNYGDGTGDQTGTVNGNICEGPAHAYIMYGSYSVTVKVTDKDGGVGSNTATHTVIFNWTGFFSPVDNLPTINSVKAGQAIPVKFNLGGDKGLNIFAVGYPTSTRVACEAGAPLDDIEQTTTAGSSSLSYDPITGQYNCVWKTEKSWAGSCRQLVVKLVDGTEHIANFRFK